MTRFVTDLDGTLLNDEPALSPFTIETLRGLNIEVLVATGRPPRLVKHVADLDAIASVAICANGAFQLDLRNGEVTTVATVSANDGLAIASAVRAVEPSATFAVETAVGHRREHVYDSPFDVPDRFKGTLDEIVADGFAKMLIRTPDGVSSDQTLALQNAVGDLGSISISNTLFYELAPAGVTKASGIAHVVGDSDYVAYGDMPNDISMLEAATVGVAVSNAAPQVKSVADVVLSLSNNEDAVARDIASRH